MTRILAVLVCALGASAFGQTPSISAVLDAGEYSNNVAPGSVFVVKGTNLVNVAGVTSAPGLPLFTRLAGVKITFTHLRITTGYEAYMVYAYKSDREQLAAILPSSVPPGEYNVAVDNNGAVSANFQVTVVGRKLRILTQDTTGTGAATVQNFVSGRYDLNRFTTGAVGGTSISPAHPGQAVVIWATGYGGMSGVADNIAPGQQDFRGSTVTRVMVGGQSIVPDLYAGRAPSLPGADEIIFTLPPNVPTGCAVNLQVIVDGQMSNPATIAIAPAGADACVSPLHSRETLARLDQGGSLTIGAFALTSFATRLNVANLGVFDGMVEEAAGAFSRFSGAQLAAASWFTNPPGSCQVFRRQGGRTALLLGTANVVTLDAGAGLTLSGPGVQAPANALARVEGKSYSLALGMTVPGLPGMPGLNPAPIVRAGTYQLRGTGGADVGAFNGSVTVGAPIAVSPALPATINRGQGLTVSWSGGGATDLVNVVGFSGTRAGGTTADPIYDAGLFVCTAQASAGRLTVPAWLLNQLPATPADGSGVGVVATLSNSTPSASNGMFTAPLTAGGNIDGGLFVANVGSLANTVYQ